MMSKKQLRYAEILTHVKSLNQAGINPTVKKVYEQHFTNKVIIHTMRIDLRILVRDGRLSMTKVKGAFQFTIVKTNVDKRQYEAVVSRVICDNCKREMKEEIKPRVFCHYCKRGMKEEKMYYRKRCCDDCKDMLKEWRSQKNRQSPINPNS